MKVFTTNTFRRIFRKLSYAQKRILKEIVNIISNEPDIGEPKTGDLIGVRIHKRQILQHLVLLVYIYNEKLKEITLVTFVTRENFSKNLKNQVLTFVD